MGHLKLTKVQVIAHKDSVKPLLEAVQKYGSFHTVSFDTPHEGTDRHKATGLQDAKDRLSSIDKTLQLLEPHRQKGDLLDELLPVKDDLSKEQADKLVENAKPDLVVSRILKLEEERSHHEKEIGQLEQTIAALGPWKKLAFTRSALSKTQRVRIETGTIPSSNLDTLRETLSEKGSTWELETVPQAEDLSEIIPVLFFCLSNEASRYMPALNEAGFQEFRLPEQFTPQKEVERLNRQIHNHKLEIKQCVHSIADKARYVKALRLARDNAACEIARMEKEGEAISTRTTVVLEGWVPLSDFPDLKHKLERFKTVYIEKIEKGEDEEEPVALANGTFASPFEVITGLYSTPQSDEYDPTPFLAPFFAVFVGLCLTDAGYGLIILLGCLALLKRLKPTGPSRNLLITLSICGVSTIIIGTLAGGFLGITSSSDTVRETFPTLNRLMVSIQESKYGFDPIKDSMFFFQMALMFGVIHVSFGHMIKAYANFEKGKVMDAVFDQFSWLSIIFGALCMIANSVQAFPGAPLGTIGMAAMVIGATLIVLFAGRENDGIAGRLGGGLFELYGVTGLFGDVLSYARLLALGLATGVIGGVVNTMAFKTLAIPYGIGYLMFIFVFVAGHLGNLGISAMGAFIHSLRLQFVEFFPKFYEGGGEAFTPLTEDRQYTFIKQDRVRSEN